MGKIIVCCIYLQYNCYHRLNYVQCTSGTIATHDCSGENTVSLVFDATIRELSTCTFNLASGRCIDQEHTCMINVQPSTSTITTSSPTITPSSVPSSYTGTVNFLLYFVTCITSLFNSIVESSDIN